MTSCIDFSLRLTKSDHVITLLCLCGFEKKQPEEKFSPPSYFLGQDFSWVTRNSSGRSYSPSTPFRAFPLGEKTKTETAEPQKMLSRDQNLLTSVYMNGVSFVTASFSMRLHLLFTRRRLKLLPKPCRFQTAAKSGAFSKRCSFICRVNSETASI